MAIYDAYGNRYSPAPKRPVNIARTVGITDPGQRWAQSLGGITPEKLFSILQLAATGDNEAYLTLAVEMEEKFLHYSAQLQTRKLAIVAEELEVTPGDDSELGQKIADEFREFVVDQECFSDMCLDLLDAVAKGYSVIQTHWDTSLTPWRPAEYEHLDPRYFTFDRSTLSKLRLKDLHSGDPDGQPLPPGLMIHTPRARTGVPCRAGLARPASVAYLFTVGNVSQWMVFAETFGMPLRLGEYDGATATDEEIAQLRTAIVNIGHNAAAIIPSGMKITFPDARRPTSGDNVFKEIALYWEQLISKIVVGQTMTADGDNSRTGASEVHDRVRLDIRRADARSECATLRKYLATPFTLWNYGPTAPVPKLARAVDPPEDLKGFSDAIAPLIGAGLRVKAQEVRDKFGLAAPEDGDEVIEAPAPPIDPNKEMAIGAKKEQAAKKPKQRRR